LGLFFSIENKTGQALEGGLLGIRYESWTVFLGEAIGYLGALLDCGKRV
jgi:Leu/Phe-tRNA-protein transferase